MVSVLFLDRLLFHPVCVFFSVCLCPVSNNKLIIIQSCIIINTRWMICGISNSSSPTIQKREWRRSASINSRLQYPSRSTISLDFLATLGLGVPDLILLLWQTYVAFCIHSWPTWQRSNLDYRDREILLSCVVWLWRRLLYPVLMATSLAYWMVL